MRGETGFVGLHFRPGNPAVDLEKARWPRNEEDQLLPLGQHPGEQEADAPRAHVAGRCLESPGHRLTGEGDGHAQARGALLHSPRLLEEEKFPGQAILRCLRSHHDAVREGSRPPLPAPD
ncbi:MAG TPA: hypothetical protein VFV36_10890, partial [Candidatus Methylomirabilis sp.]|nr:hypothetical protein [Candidatus Methylomirabilis sp.]